MKIFLTKVKNQLQKNKKPNQFLGEWCWPDNKSKNNEQTINYHWNNRKKLKRDYYKLLKIYEITLDALAKKLNLIHKKSYSKRFWRILVGAWLLYFIQICFDRWFMIKQAIKEKRKFTATFSIISKQKSVPENMKEFVQLISTDEYNGFIFKEVLEFIKNKNIIINAQKVKNNKKNNYKLNLQWKEKCKTLANLIKKLFRCIYLNNKVFIYKSCLNHLNELLLNIIIKNFAPFSFQQVQKSSKERKLNIFIRSQKIKIQKTNLICFSKFLEKSVIKNIPLAYLEKFQELNESSLKQSWPTHPKVIFTTNGYLHDEEFKLYAARCTESGSTFLIAQHGGGFGLTSWQADEYHQKCIADHFLTWGWREKNNSKALPFGIIPDYAEINLKAKTNGDALLVGLSIPRYSYRMFSFPVSSCQWSHYFSNIQTFADSLDGNIKKALLVRFEKNSYGHFEKERCVNKSLNLRFDDGNLSIQEKLKKSRICICTYNGTTFLETFAANFPTIVFWDPKQFELRENAKKSFQKLAEAGVFFENPKSAAQFLNTSWNHIDEWWKSRKVQNAVAQFTKKYALRRQNKIKNLACIIKKFLRKEKYAF